MRSRFRNKNQIPCLTEANDKSTNDDRPKSPISPGTFLNNLDTLTDYIQALTPKKQTKEILGQEQPQLKYTLPESFSNSSPRIIRIQPQGLQSTVSQSPKHVFFRQKTTEIDFVNNVQSDGQLKQSDEQQKQSIFRKMAEQLVEPQKKRQHFRTQSEQLTVNTSQDEVIDVIRTKTYKKTSHFKKQAIQ